MELLNVRMHDGSRLFASFAESCTWEQLRQHMAELGGVQITHFVTDGVTEMWLNFTFRNQCFSINNPHGEYWFFVTDPACPRDILEETARHAALLLDA